MLILTYVAEKVLEVVAPGVVVGIQNSGVHVFFLMIRFPVVELPMTIVKLILTHFKHIYVF